MAAAGDLFESVDDDEILASWRKSDHHKSDQPKQSSRDSARAQPTANQAGKAGLFDSDSEESEQPSATTSKPNTKAPPKALPVEAPTTAPRGSAPQMSGGLFGSDSEDDDFTVAQPKPAVAKATSEGIFGNGAAPSRPAPKAAVPTGLFGDDSDDDESENGLFGSGPAPASGLFGGPAPAPAPEPAAAQGWDASSVGRLIDMGFATVDAEAALEAKGGDVQQAAEWLLAGGTAVAAGRTSPDAAAGSAAEPAASDGGPAALAAAPADGGLDQSSAFHGAQPQRSRHFSHRAALARLNGRGVSFNDRRGGLLAASRCGCCAGRCCRRVGRCHLGQRSAPCDG